MDNCEAWKWKRHNGVWKGKGEASGEGREHYGRTATLIGHNVWEYGSNGLRDQDRCFYILNVKSKTWKALPLRLDQWQLPGLDLSLGNLFQDKIYFFGQTIPNSKLQNAFDLWVCDPVLQEIKPCQTYGAEHSTRITEQSADICERLGCLAVFGGYPYDGERQLWLLDFRTMLWTRAETKGPAPSARSMHASCVVSSVLYIYHGAHGGTNLSDCYRIDLSQRQNLVWHKIKFNNGDGTGRMEATMIHVGSGRMIVFGGSPDTLVLEATRSANPIRRKLPFQGDRPSPRASAQMFHAHKTVYIIGGRHTDKWNYFEICPA